MGCDLQEWFSGSCGAQSDENSLEENNGLHQGEKDTSISIQVNLSNFDAKRNCLNCLCEQYPEAVASGMMNVAQNILSTANTLVPVRTGYLKSTIAIEQPTKFQIKVKATAPYAYYVEFGTKKMSARLFLTNSVNQHLNELALEIEQQIKDLLKG